MARGDEYDFDEKTGMPKRVPSSRRKEQVQDLNEEESKTANQRSDDEEPAEGARREGAVAKSVVANLPGGGSIALMNNEELDWFEAVKNNYSSSYNFTHPNDLSRLSQLIVCELQVHRMMQILGGKIPVYDDDYLLVGYKNVSQEKQQHAIDNLPKIQQEIRKLETALRIDKKTRDGDGVGEVREYVENLKAAANAWGVHLSERYKIIDNFMADIMWMNRVYKLDDVEDKKYHDLETPEKFLNQIGKMIEEIQEFDKEFRKDKHSVFLMKGVP